MKKILTLIIILCCFTLYSNDFNVLKVGDGVNLMICQGDFNIYDNNNVDVKFNNDTISFSTKEKKSVVTLSIRYFNEIICDGVSSVLTLSNMLLDSINLITTENSTIILYITNTHFHLDAIGNGNVVLSGDIYYLDLVASNDISIDVNVFSYVININLSDEVELSMNGRCDEVKCKLIDYSYLKAFNMIVRYYDLDMCCNSDACINVSEKLKIDGNGDSSVFYKGEPVDINIDIDGNFYVRNSK